MTKFYREHCRMLVKLWPTQILCVAGFSAVVNMVSKGQLQPLVH